MKKTLSPGHARASRIPDDERARALAVDVLAFLAEEPDHLHRFFDLTGSSVDTLRQVAGTRAFHTSLLDFLASDETVLVAFATRYGLDPAEVGRICMSVSQPWAAD